MAVAHPSDERQPNDVADRRVLVVVDDLEHPDERADLAAALGALTADADRVELWIRRRGRLEVPSVRVRRIDELRTWSSAVALDRLGGSVGAHLRGLRLRWWNRRLRPHVVVLVGDAALDAVPRPPATVVRAPWAATESGETGTERVVVPLAPFGEIAGHRGRGRSDPAVLRRALALPPSGGAMVAWPAAPEVLADLTWLADVRAERGDVWLVADCAPDPSARDAVREAARAAGVADAVHLRPLDAAAAASLASPLVVWQEPTREQVAVATADGLELIVVLPDRPEPGAPRWTVEPPPQGPWSAERWALQVVTAR